MWTARFAKSDIIVRNRKGRSEVKYVVSKRVDRWIERTSAAVLVFAALYLSGHIVWAVAR